MPPLTVMPVDLMSCLRPRLVSHASPSHADKRERVSGNRAVHAHLAHILGIDSMIDVSHGLYATWSLMRSAGLEGAQACVNIDTMPRAGCSQNT